MFGVKYLENLLIGKNLKFFDSVLEFLYFDMLKNEGRGSNRLGVKKSQKTHVVRVTEAECNMLNNVVVQHKKNKQKKKSE